MSADASRGFGPAFNLTLNSQKSYYFGIENSRVPGEFLEEFALTLQKDKNHGRRPAEARSFKLGEIKK